MTTETDTPRAPRFEQRSFWALVAEDTFDPIVERVKAMLSGDRRMVLIQRYLHRTDLRTHVGMRLDTGEEWSDTTLDPFKVSATRYGRFFSASLTPGIHCVSFRTEGNGTEQRMREAWNSRGKGTYDRPVTQIYVDGWPNDPSREDRIEIEHWNEHGVGQSTLVLFQTDWG